MKTERKSVRILDGPVGTRLEALGMPLSAPLWSAAAIETRPELLARIHLEYAAAGATVHTAATFRTKTSDAGDAASRLTRQAVALCRSVVPSHHQVFGSMAPVADCYRPAETPANTAPIHRAHAETLAEAGVDGLLVETFAHAREITEAVEAAVSTGLPVWASFTAGPDGTLLTTAEARDIAHRVHDCGAEVVLVNCTAIDRCAPFTAMLRDSGLPWGCAPNAGAMDAGFGWGRGEPGAVDAYFRTWLDAGASVLGACCGMRPEHIARIRALVQG